MNERIFESAFSLTETYPATVVAAILAGKTLRTEVFIGALFRYLWNVHFTFESGNCFEGHE